MPKPAAVFLGSQLVGPVMVPSELGFGPVYEAAKWLADRRFGKAELAVNIDVTHPGLALNRSRPPILKH